MKTSMLALALALVAPAAFSQTVTSPVVAPVQKHAVKRAAKHAKAPKIDPATAVKIKNLRAEIKRERAEMSAKSHALKSGHAELAGQETAELAKVKAGLGQKAEKKQERTAVLRKYAGLFKDAREKTRSERSFLREDIKAKRQMISKLRQA
jgi:glucose/arabinose dehydrogenase